MTERPQKSLVLRRLERLELTEEFHDRKREFLADGMSDDEAFYQAYGVVIPEGSDAMLATLQRRVDFARDFAWAWSNLGNKAVRKDAPSRSAWFLLEVGRDNRTKFIEQAMKFFVAKGKQDDDDKAFEDDQRMLFKLLDQFPETEARVRESLRETWKKHPDLVISVTGLVESPAVVPTTTT